jgi:hypothetical protein
MPYITEKQRKEIEEGKTPENCGELNYCFSILIDQYLGGIVNYQRINDILGALEGAKLELYRRVAISYEDQKRYDHGDVYSVKNTQSDRQKDPHDLSS